MDETESRKALLNMQLDVIAGKQHTLYGNGEYPLQINSEVKEMPNQLVNAGNIKKSKSDLALNIGVPTQTGWRNFTVSIAQVQKVISGEREFTGMSEIIPKE